MRPSNAALMRTAPLPWSYQRENEIVKFMRCINEQKACNLCKGKPNLNVDGWKVLHKSQDNEIIVGESNFHGQSIFLMQDSHGSSTATNNLVWTK